MPGNISSLSLFRISLGCLHGMHQIDRDKIPDGVHFKFTKEDEQWLTKWMKENLLSLNPPLNLENTSADMAEFRLKLSVLRHAFAALRYRRSGINPFSYLGRVYYLLAGNN